MPAGAPPSLKVGTHEGNSPCNKSLGRVPLCELVNFASKSKGTNIGPRD